MGRDRRTLGGFALKAGVTRAAETLGIPARTLPSDASTARPDVAPSDFHCIVRMRWRTRELLVAKWGVGSSASTGRDRESVITARAETLPRSPSLRNAWYAGRRCVVPADGFLQWVGDRQSRRPLWFHRPDNGLFFFAGLYESLRPSPDRLQRAFTIVTTSTNGGTTAHDRVPVIVPDEHLDEWLFQGNAPEQVQRLLAPVSAEYLESLPIEEAASSESRNAVTWNPGRRQRAARLE
jgi:putative SOS response-associated peptidase YedK